MNTVAQLNIKKMDSTKKKNELLRKVRKGE